MKKLNGILWGIALVAAGIIFSLSALEIISVNTFFTGWWTLFIIVPCFIGLITDRDKTGSVIGLCVGVLLMLCARGVLSYSVFWKLLIPAVIIIIGIRIIVGSIVGQTKNGDFKKFTPTDGQKVGTAVFSGSKLDYVGENFDGADLCAVFGGVECDLRGAIFDGDKTLRATAVFGGVDITVPENIRVVVSSTSFFGGAEDKRRLKSNGEYTLYITATCIFGGVEIK